MAIVQCINGHHYDDSKHKECPHCQNEEFIDYEATVDLPGWTKDNYDETIDIYVGGGEVKDDDKTVGAYSFEKGTQLLAGWLVCTKGPNRGKDYKLFHGWNRIGRKFSMDIYIPDDLKISADNHSAIVYDDRGNMFYLVNEQASLTYLNGTYTVESVEIKNGDLIQMGDSEFVFIAFCTEDRKWENE